MIGIKKENKMVEIQYVRWGLANRFSNPDCIELNEALRTNIKLHDAILKHELGHKIDNTFKKDLFHDLTPIGSLSQKDLIIFMIKHPRTITQLLPFYWSPRRKELVYDINMLIIYAVTVSIIAWGLILI